MRLCAGGRLCGGGRRTGWVVLVLEVGLLEVGGGWGCQGTATGLGRGGESISGVEMFEGLKAEEGGVVFIRREFE